MTKEEQLKIYSAYLPYRLNLKSGEFITEMCASKKYILDDYEHEFTSIDDLCYTVNHTYKPILYDLSYLTKEIEHEGRKFIPMHLLKNGGTDLNEYRFLEWKGYSVIDNEEHETCYDPETMSFYQFYMGESRMCTGQYEKFQMLLKWHFNVFNLPESEYINKATLTQKK